MPVIISGDLQVTGSVSFNDDLQVASGATITILPGGSLNLTGHKMLLFGTLKFAGNTTSFAELTNGVISTDSTQGRVIGSFGKFTSATIDDFFSNGSMEITNSYFLNSEVRGFQSTQIAGSLFLNSTITLSGTKTTTISSSTLIDSPVSVTAWRGSFIGKITLNDDNFVMGSSGDVLTLSPFFSGAGFYHPVSISNSYIKLSSPETIDSRIYDANDDLRVATDIVASNFRSSPLLNDSAGFRVGSVLISAGDLGAEVATPGDDIFHGTLAADTLIGGAGNDTYYVDHTGDSVVELPGEGADTEVASLSVYLPANVENLSLTGTAYFGVGNALANVIVGSNAGNLLLGGDGNDTIRGGELRDAIFGESGNDSISGGGGVDYLIGGTGNDTIDGGTGADEIYGEDGSDSISGGSDFQTDILVGGAGNDTLDGGPAWDQMYGGTGDDTFYVSQQVDWVFENPNEGYDTVIADSPNGFYLYANIEKLVFTGTTPFGVGNELNNLIIGNAIGNVLLGGAGNDTLDGGAGQDILWGEAGADTFLIRKGTGIDIIADFTPGTDRLDVRDYEFKTTAAFTSRMTQVGAGVSVDLGGGDSLILMGVKMTNLGTTDLLVV